MPRTLVDRVIPDVPVRQWVLSLPRRLRYRLAWDHDLCRRVTTVFLGAVFRLLRDHARAAGLEQPRGGAVAIIQRFPPGYPITPALFILSALVIVVNTVMTQPRQSLIGLGIPLLGTPAYLWWRASYRKWGDAG